MNSLIRYAFNIQCNDITNALRCTRERLLPDATLISPHFNLTVEIPLKAVIRGYSFEVIPISWKNRTKGV